MPRRRMIDPSFNDDIEVGGLTRDERLFVVGSLSNADDDGRLIGNCSFLKSRIFTYDSDIDDARMKEIKESALEKMSRWRPDHIFLIKGYINGTQEYLHFVNWAASNKPSHPTPSKLPAPPKATPEEFTQTSGDGQESIVSNSGASPSQVRSGQSSLGQVRLGQVREVPEDFSSFLTDEKDLTDFLTTVLTEYMPRGPTHTMVPIKKLWRQATGKEVSTELFQVIYAALQKYPIPVLARSLVKAVKYTPGKRKPANYLAIVFDEQLDEYEKAQSKGNKDPP